MREFEQLESLINRQIDFGLLTEEEEQLAKNSFLKIESQITPPTQYMEFIQEFNKVRKTTYKPDIESRKLFYDNITIYSISDLIKALKNALTNPYFKEHAFPITPEWILKNTATYLNYEPPKSSKGNTSKSDTGLDRPAAV
jgi:hypothetical protein